MVDILTLSGTVKGQVELPEAWFNRTGPKGVVWESVRCLLANRREGNAMTKTRAEVSGTGKKPWRQKHTGRARHGSRRTNIWVGGGVVFGPRPRDYGYEIPKKERKLALALTLSARNRDGALKVIEDIEPAHPKTKELLQALAGLNLSGKVLLLVDSLTENLRLASRNIPWLTVMPARLVNAYEVLAHEQVVFTERGLASFLATVGGKS
ncbi:MAG: 50S ribosomal protein L4 [candidate division WOR-3 bacterium]